MEEKEEGEEASGEREKSQKKIKLSTKKLNAICSALEEILDIFKNNPIYESGDTATKRYPKFLTARSLLEI